MGPLPQVGDVLAGKYTIVDKLGEGGMGVVFEAYHAGLRQRCAVKLLRPQIASDREAVTRFAREARAAASLASPHVCRVTDVDESGGTPFMVMELLVGSNLEELLEAHGRIPWRTAIGYLLEACDAMSEAHSKGIVHRDLKPENLFLVQHDGRQLIKVLDFGISKLAHEDVSVTRTQSALGTPLYMSPEQCRSTKSVDHRTDIWSLGVILYELVTGQLPFLGDSPAALAVAVTIDSFAPPTTLDPTLPSAFDPILARALAKDPKDRFASVEEFARALTGLAAGLNPPVVEDATVQLAATSLTSARDPSPAPRTTGLLMGTGAVAALGLMAIAYFTVGSSRPQGSGIVADPEPATSAVEHAREEGPAVVAAPTPSTSNAPSTTAVAVVPDPNRTTRPSATGGRPGAGAPSTSIGPSASNAPAKTAAPASPVATPGGLPLFIPQK